MARPAPESVSCFRACKTNRSTEMVIGPGRGCGTCPSGSGDPGDISRRTKRRRREGRKGGESRGESGRGGSAGGAASRGHDEALDLLTGPGPSAVCTLHPSHRNPGRRLRKARPPAGAGSGTEEVGGCGEASAGWKAVAYRSPPGASRLRPAPQAGWQLCAKAQPEPSLCFGSRQTSGPCRAGSCG